MTFSEQAEAPVQSSQHRLRSLETVKKLASVGDMSALETEVQTGGLGDLPRSDNRGRAGAILDSPAQLVQWGLVNYPELPTNEVQLLAGKALGLPLRIDALIFATGPVSSSSQETFAELLKQRRRGVPLQHLLEEMSFRGLELHCRPGVFVVRPETEVLVETALNCLKSLDAAQKDQQKRSQTRQVVVDLCTGSGAIALSIAQESDAQVWGIEKHDRPWEVANENLQRYSDLRFQVTLIKGDATDPKLEIYQELSGKAELVVTNPPYVPAGDVSQVEASFDPPAALWGGGEDGLEIPRKLLPIAWDLLKPGGWLVMEHAEKQASALRDFATQTGWINVQTGIDLTKRPRFLQAQKRPGRSQND